ncbi:MAG: hypothetical protein A2147_09840 [Chloroflexi bacterium RBG_16_57_8]|nr:MAG: hypothetical protein A2147_09840 [Chloroflexi bacterium RBG_16_57_8]
MGHTGRIKIGVLLAGIVVGIIGVLAGIALLSSSTASARPSYGSNCGDCHGTISSSAGPNGSISPSGATLVAPPGSDQSYTIRADTGYHVDSVLVDGTSAGALTTYTFTNVSADHTIAATFAANAPTTYTLTYTAGANGSISGTSPQTVASESSGTAVTAVAATGYHFVSWSDGSTANPRTDTNVTANTSVTANFAADAPVPLTYTIAASVMPATGGSVGGDGTFESGAAVSLQATANPGYSFVNWTEDASVVSTSASYSFTANDNRTLVANFVADPPLPAPGSDSTGPLTRSIRFEQSRKTGELRAVIDDTYAGGTNVIAAEYFLDSVGVAGSGTAMVASDGAFNSLREAVKARVDLSSLPHGTHTIYVRGRDAAGNWGEWSSVTFRVKTPWHSSDDDRDEDGDEHDNRDGDRDDDRRED